jgi:beta-1,4-N-acetylglucosaminyltransferase
MALVATAAVLLLVNLVLRVLVVGLSPPPPRPLGGRGGGALRTMVVLGSGGHTAEMFAILRALDPARYTPRAYVLAASDSTSASKVGRRRLTTG